MNAPHTLEVVGEGTLAVIELEGEEHLGGLYRWRLRCEAPRGAAASLTRWSGRRARLLLGAGLTSTISAALQADAEGRAIWGQVSQLKLYRAHGVPTLELVLEPRIAQLAHVQVNHVFLDQSSVETIQTVLALCGLSAQWQVWMLEQTYPRFAQRTAYQQNALEFIQWLLQYEGIAMRFEHGEAGERMVFFDGLSGYERGNRYMTGLRVAPRGNLVNDDEPEVLTRAALNASARVEAVELTEYDHQQAHQDLSVQVQTARPANQDATPPITAHHHGEHYKSLADGERLARVRLQAQQCGVRTLSGKGPLIALQAGGVLRVDTAPYAGLWLVTRVRLRSHRDARLQVRFEASDATQPWRPERTVQRPVVHGVIAAQVIGGSQIANLDEQGRYRVQYPWAAAAQSKAIRMAQPYAGPTYGVHAPLKGQTEVWLSHANGDPDRPVILGASHHGGQPDVVRARDNSRNVIRTLAGNKLRLEDRQGQEHIKLHTPANTTQLNLGHHVDHAKTRRGQGVELRSDAHGVIRTGQQLFLTTGRASPRGGGAEPGSVNEATRTAASADIRSTLSNLQSLIGNRSLAAEQAGACQNQGIASGQWLNNALKQTAGTALGESKPHQVHWSQAGSVSAGPTIDLAGSRHVALHALRSQDWLAGGPLQLASRDGTRIHIEQGGRKSFVSQGDHQTFVSQGSFHLVVEGSIKIQSQGQAVSLKAGASTVILTEGGHAGIKASSAVYAAGLHVSRAVTVNMQGGGSAQTPEAMTSKRLEDMGPYKGQYQLFKTDERAFVGYGYEIRDLNDKVLAQGLTAADGKTAVVNSSETAVLRVYKSAVRVGERIVEPWDAALTAASKAVPGGASGQSERSN